MNNGANSSCYIQRMSDELKDTEALLSEADSDAGTAADVEGYESENIEPYEFATPLDDADAATEGDDGA